MPALLGAVAVAGLRKIIGLSRGRQAALVVIAVAAVSVTLLAALREPTPRSPPQAGGMVRVAAPRPIVPSAAEPRDEREKARLDAAPASPAPSGARWISISYRRLLNTSLITHSGRTVGELLAVPADTRASDPTADLQPHLEPLSFVCSDLVTAHRPLDEMPYVNAVAGYPPGSAQPAWAALFREGLYQLFVNDKRARLFLKGTDPGRLLEQHRSVVRHALLAALDSMGRDRMEVEVYAYTNDYHNQTIRLDLQPVVEAVSRSDLGPSRIPLPLEGLGGLLERGGPLEALEIDNDGHMFLYAQAAGDKTVGGAPQSLADLAVVYRAVFHNGKNPPYISLDKHEDNRLAKVNFGGLLADTRVGSVVLEADKLFKTLSTGLHPGSRQNVIADVVRHVPGFLTEDDRSLQQSDSLVAQCIRYWFYPDKIRTVTDGRIGAVETCQFFADAERMVDANSKGASKPLGPAQRATIDHLNDHFEQYARVFRPFRELSTVGRMMALVNWLREADNSSKADLDGFLSVELPAVTTDRSTKKLLAASVASSIQSKHGRERGPVAVVALADLLDQMRPEAADDDLLARARAHMRAREWDDLLPPHARRLRTDLDVAERDLKGRQADQEALGARLERERAALDRSDSSAVNKFNALVDRHESLRLAYNEAVASFNGQREAFAKLVIETNTVVSVGGGINLEPQSFARPSRQADSPLLGAVRAAREAKGSSSVREGLVRSAPTAGEARRSRDGESAGRWQRAAVGKQEGAIEGRWAKDGSSDAAIRKVPGRREMRYSVRTPTYFAETTLKPDERTTVIANSLYPAEIVAFGEVTPGGTVVLRRGREIRSSADTPVWGAR